MLNGTKAWVTLGGVADRIMVFARTGKEAGHKSISCFMVDAHQAGVSRGKNEELLGMHGLEDCQIVLQDVHVAWRRPRWKTRWPTPPRASSSASRS